MNQTTDADKIRNMQRIIDIQDMLITNQKKILGNNERLIENLTKMRDFWKIQAEKMNQIAKEAIALGDISCHL